MPMISDRHEIRKILDVSHSIAVVGISDRPGRDSFHVSGYMLSQGYRIIPVNPNVRSVHGIECLPDLDAIGEPVDIVDIFRRSEFVPDIVEAAIRIHALTVWMQVGVINQAAADRAVAAGLNVVMDRCIMVEHRFR